ncbi:MAG: hypothetical protein IJU25_03030 [Lachnospiraceae bacterium]|nr:hypothetical protein [Lachnospiraceae bacterium]
MTIYKCRAGVVLTKICGEYLLVAAKNLLEYCPYVTQIDENTAFVWKELKKGVTLQELLISTAKAYQEELEEIETPLNMIVRELYEMGYLIEEERNGQDNEKE